MSKQTKFLCDNCNKESSFTTTYPYADGWVYLYDVEVKLNEGRFFKSKDKHFCGVDCLNEFIKKETAKGSVK